MLTITEIESLIASGEGYNVEFKKAPPSKAKELSEEVCAFANAAGGVLLIGVDDNNQITGADINNAKRSAIQDSINEITPHLPVAIYSVKVQGKTIWLIEVESGQNKPYALSGAIYVRQGPNTQKLTSIDQMRDFFQQSEKIYFEETPCADFNIQEDLDEELFEEFKIDAKISKAISKEQILKNLKLTAPNGQMKNAGVLFFAKFVEQFFSHAVVRCVHYDGTNKTNIIDDKTFGGSILRQYQRSLNWIKQKISVRYEIEGSGPRKEYWEIPEVVFKEAIINALAHRDYYDKGASIFIEVFNNRIEITNPGGLSSAIKLEEFGTKSHSRNPLLFGLLVRIQMVEQVGSGIGRIQDNLESAYLPAAVFKTDGMFSIVLNRKHTANTIREETQKTREETQKTREETQKTGEETQKTGEETEKARDEILKNMSTNPNITTDELAVIVGITPKGIEYHIKKLKNEKIIERQGPTKGGQWVVINKKK